MGVGWPPDGGALTSSMGVLAVHKIFSAVQIFVKKAWRCRDRCSRFGFPNPKCFYAPRAQFRPDVIQPH